VKNLRTWIFGFGITIYIYTRPPSGAVSYYNDRLIRSPRLHLEIDRLSIKRGDRPEMHLIAGGI
jgi:hypothetical protein